MSIANLIKISPVLGLKCIFSKLVELFNINLLMRCKKDIVL